MSSWFWLSRVVCFVSDLLRYVRMYAAAILFPVERMKRSFSRFLFYLPLFDLSVYHRR